MASLADSFLEDLDDLGESDDEQDVDDRINAESIPNDLSSSSGSSSSSSRDISSSSVNTGGDGDATANIATQKDIKLVATLRKSEDFQAQMARIEESLSRPAVAIVGRIEDNPEYRLIVSCSDLVSKIDEEVLVIYRYVVDLYSKKFPELESLVPGRQEYLKVVKEMGNEMDMTNGIDLSSMLPNAVVISVSMTASTTSGQPLSESDLQQCMMGCDEAALLDEARAKILQFVETRMTAVAPNVCAILDTAIAAQLMGLCGGLVEMSKMPACNLRVVGQQKLQKKLL